MTTVTGKLTTPGGTLPSNAAVTAVLVDYFNNPVVGFDTTGQAEILSTLLIPVNSDGTWTAQFTPNAQIQLAGGAAQTAWRITEIGAGADGTYWIVVPSGGPFWVGTLRTTLVGGTAPQVPVNLAVAGALSVGGAFTLDGIAVAAPPSITTEFLSGDGTWRTPGGGPPSGAAGGDLTGSTYPNPVLASTANVRSIIDARIPAALPPNGAAGGDLAGTYPAPSVAKVNGVAVTGTPSAGQVPVATSPTAAAWGTIAAPRDRRSASLGLLGQPFDYGAINDTGLGLTSGFLILMLCMPDAGSVAALDLLLGGAGSGATGASNVCAYNESGSQLLAVSGDVTTQLSTVGNANTVLRLPFTTPFAADGVTSFYFGIFCQMSSNPTIGGVFASLHLPAVNGHKPGIVVGGLSSVPSTINVGAANPAGASYWLAPSP